MANKLSEKKRLAMWAAWQDKQSERHVAQKCALSPNTIRRYRRLDNWDERLAAIVKKAQKKADNGAASVLARHIKETQLLQKKGIEFLQTHKIKTEQTAVKAMEVGIRLEREIAGEPVRLEITKKYEDMDLKELYALLQQLKQAGKH
jgi:hypothetical protein